MRVVKDIDGRLKEIDPRNKISKAELVKAGKPVDVEVEGGWMRRIFDKDVLVFTQENGHSAFLFTSEYVDILSKVHKNG